MKISKLEIIARDRVNQPLYPYVKPTDYYLDILGEKSPTEAAMIDNVAILKMTADDGSSSYFNTSSLVADYALTLFRKIENWDASEIGMAWDFLYRYSLPLGRAGVSMHAISVINLMMYDLYARHLKVPVYDLLGGKTRGKIKAYASHLHPLPVKELQFRTSQWLLGKSGDSFYPCGSFITTADEIRDPQKLTIRTRLNGELRQDSDTSYMIFSCSYLISSISRFMTLYPGDIISTGTPEGVILRMPEDRRVWIRSGDRVSVEIEGLGRLENTFS
jgi:hypothetical protein